MFFVMGINFFTTRELLGALGTENFGILNIIAGIISLFSSGSAVMSVSASRFFNIEIGRGNRLGLKRVFAQTQTTYIILACILFFGVETIGKWIFLTKLNIPKEAYESAFHLFHFTAIIFFFELLVIPYTSFVISCENMKIYAIISIFEVILKLLIVYLLYLDIFPRLTFYGFLLLLVSCSKLSTYMIFCILKYKETKPSLYFNYGIFKELATFSTFNLINASVIVGTNVICNILLNNFFGAVINAARAISQQISSGLSNFTNGFLVAANPQITKYWASSQKEQCKTLVLSATRFGFYLIYIFSLPVFIEMDYILALWLKTPPEYTTEFCRLALIQLIIEVTGYPIMTFAQSIGKPALRRFTLGYIVLLFALPISYIEIKIGYNPTSVQLILCICTSICLLFRIFLIQRLTDISIPEFIRKIYIPCMTIAFISAFIPTIIYFNISTSALRFVLETVTSFLCSGITIYFCGLTKKEKMKINLQIKKILTSMNR